MDWPQPQTLEALMAMDAGKLWASVSYCAGSPRWIAMDGPKPITRFIYATKQEAYAAKARIDQFGCGGGCEEWHAVEMALPNEKVKKSYDIERKAYGRYGGTIPEIFLLPDERRRQQQPMLPGLTTSATQRQKLGAVYLIQAEGHMPIKIGHGTSATNRLKQFQIGCPLKLSIIREIPHQEHAKLEKLLHKRYDAFKVHGEWFALPPEVLAALLREEFA